MDSGLRYIGADHVETPSGMLDGTVLVSPREETVGRVDGIVVDPIARRVRYFVVKSCAWLRSRRHLVPATPARLDAEHKALHVDIEPGDLSRYREVRADAFRRFSDDDLIAALFSAR